MTTHSIILKSLTFFLTLYFGALCTPPISAANELGARENLLKAKVIHSISHFISWPAESNTKRFNLCVLGENTEFYNALKLIYEHKTHFKNKSISILKTNIDLVDNCNILFISEISKTQLQNAIKKLKHKPILLCSDSTGYAELGTHINLYVDNNKVRFEVNFEASKNAGLGLSSQLLRLARLVKAKG